MNMHDVVVIGGGFYGCRIALEMRKAGFEVLLLEQEKGLLQRASYHNQARVHNGYHYPLSITTALRSRINFPRFIEEYASCVEKGFEKYYAISKFQSNISAEQFKVFCKEIGAPLKKAPADIRALFNPDLIEEVFTVQEYAFNADKLRETVAAQLEEAGVETRLGCEVTKIAAAEGGIALECDGEGGRNQLFAKKVLNCTYAQINKLLHASRLPLVPLKMEMTEMALVEMPASLKNKGITVMSGPFFSFMPFPARPGLHTVSHVRYTPHSHWIDRGQDYLDAAEYFKVANTKSNFPKMIGDITRYIPSMAGCEQKDSLWELKTTMMTSEKDKSRPILYLEDYSIPGFSCIMGGKIDNIYDIIDRLQDSLLHSA